MSTQEQVATLNQNSTWFGADITRLSEEGDWTDLLAGQPIFVEQNDIDQMAKLISTISSLAENSEYQKEVFALHPWLKSAESVTRGALFGYDFHLTSDGPKLVEVNTNAGGILFNQKLEQVQRSCCKYAKSLMMSPVDAGKSVEEKIISMFKHEFSSLRKDKALKTIAILDNDPEAQFLFPEFEMFQRLFEVAGIRAFIVDPSNLAYDGESIFYEESKIDLIYNRHTDFYLENKSMAQVKTAYLDRNVVLTPNPRNYALMADKRRLSMWSDQAFLESIDMPTASRDQLLGHVPKSVLVTRKNSKALWGDRKRWFFKPVVGYGSKAVYKGAKLTRKTWGYIEASESYIAQEFITPSTRVFDHLGQAQTYKVDIRNYVYDDEPILLSARLFQGQATNMRTPGGGFATVYRAP